MRNDVGFLGLKLALSHLGNQRGRKAIVWRQAAQSDAIVELIYLAYGDKINATSGNEPDVPPGTETALGDGTILDSLRKIFKGILDNQDEIFAFIEKLIALLSLFGGVPG